MQLNLYFLPVEV